jgi:hypothetical protein
VLRSSLSSHLHAIVCHLLALFSQDGDDVNRRAASESYQQQLDWRGSTRALVIGIERLGVPARGNGNEQIVSGRIDDRFSVWRAH